MNDERFTRREFSMGVAATLPLGVTDGPPTIPEIVAENDDARSQRESTAQQNSGLELEITTPTGTPVSEPEINIYDGNYDLLETATGDSDGRIVLSQDSYSDVGFVIKGSNGWFRTEQMQSGASANLTEDVTLVTHDQILSEPVLVQDDIGPLAVVTIWRTIRDSYQLLSLELTTTDTVAGDDTPVYHLRGAYDFESGAFSIEYPQESVRVNYGAQTAGMDAPHAVETLSLSTSEIPVYLEEPNYKPYDILHPKHPDSLGVPLSEAVGFDGYETSSSRDCSDAAVSDMTDPNCSKEVIQEGIGMLIGGTERGGILTAWIDSIKWAFGDPLARSASYPDPIKAKARDPNKYDEAALSWSKSGESSVVFQAPIEFKQSDDVELTFRAEWQMPSDLGFGSGSGQFQQSLSVGPVSPTAVVGSDPPKNVDDDSLYEDVDGDGDVDMDDVDALAENLDSAAVQNNVEIYDFNGNGRIDYDDVVELADEAE